VVGLHGDENPFDREDVVHVVAIDARLNEYARSDAGIPTIDVRSTSRTGGSSIPRGVR
jgi:hypothetical protein